MEGERKLFALRKAAGEGEVQQLRKRVEQLHDEITGLKAQEAGKASELALTREELGSIRKLWQQKLIQRSRLLDLERSVGASKASADSLLPRSRRPKAGSARPNSPSSRSKRHGAAMSPTSCERRRRNRQA